MKKFFLLLLMVCTTLGMFAQFEGGKKYANVSMTGLGISYNSSEKLRFGLEGTAGYFVGDCLMARAVLAYNHEKHNDKLSVGAGMRYYFDQCGVFLGAGAEYVHHSPNWNDVQIPLEVGYAFFLNRYLTVEPAIYYKMSLDDFSDKSTVGLRVGFGFYF